VDGQRGERTGFIGLGRMGLPMARCLAQKGRHVVAFDLSAAALAAAQTFGAAAATGPAAVARQCATVITMLPGLDDVRAVVLGTARDGLVSGLQRGDLVVDMSSSQPQGSVDLGGSLAAAGIGFIDAPVSGGVRRAENGELSIMVGGREDLVERAMPLLCCMGRNIYRTGSVGTGQAMKALNNMVSAAGLISALEALLIGRHFGLEPELMVDVLNASTGRNNSTENKVKQFVLSGRYDSGFDLDLMVKDLRAAIGLADELQITSIVGHSTLREAEAAAAVLGRGADHTAIARYLERR
jgi:3-hydroxyisobutyrate dehydrogenase